MPFLFKKILPIFILAIFTSAGFGFGIYYTQTQLPPPPIKGVVNLENGQPEGVDFSLFWDAWRVVQEKYAGKENLDFQKMVYGAISGMVESLGDSYSVFLPPKEAKIFKEDVAGEFQGVGMEIDIKDGELTVISPLDGTPAKKAGLRAGDKIIKIDDVSAADLTLDEAVKLIRGPRGSEVVLTVLRSGWEEPKEFKVIRDVIEVPSLKLEILASPNDNIAYIKLYHFTGKANYDFSSAAIKILDSPAQKIILDLRNNPGGYLEVAQNIAGWFLTKGQVVAIEDFGVKKEKKEYKAEGNGALASYPIVVLINKGSASAAEILAGALRDNRGAKLIGETSFGKGSVQELEELKGGSNLKITVAKWLTPKGEFITDKGLKPDTESLMTDKDYEDGKDPQLDKAIEIINEIR